MSHDIIADALNKIMNAKKSRKKEVVVPIYSDLLIRVLDIAIQYNYIQEYKKDKTKLTIIIGKELNQCGVIKPRFNVKKDKVEFYRRRYLPAKDMGIIIISTNKNLITHNEAILNKTGGSLIAYFY